MKKQLMTFLLWQSVRYGAATGRLCEPLHRYEQLRYDESRRGLSAGYDERGSFQRHGVGEEPF